jgi:hypothetical protein
MPEQHPEVRPLVVGGDEETAVHVGMAARLVTQQPTNAL